MVVDKDSKKYLEVFDYVKERVKKESLLRFYLRWLELREYHEMQDMLNKGSQLYMEIESGINKVKAISFMGICKNKSSKGKEKTVEYVLEKVIDSSSKEFLHVKKRLVFAVCGNVPLDDFLDLMKNTKEKLPYEEYKDKFSKNYETIVSNLSTIFNLETFTNYQEDISNLFGFPEESIEEIKGMIIEKDKDVPTPVEEKQEEIVDTSKPEKKTKDKSEQQYKKEINKLQSKLTKLEEENEKLSKENKTQTRDYEKKIKEYEQKVNKLSKETLSGIETKTQKENKKLKEENKKLSDELGELQYKLSSLEETIHQKAEEAIAEPIVEVKETKEKILTINDSTKEKEFIQQLSDALQNAALSYKPEDILNFHVALKSSMLTILAGPSGTGKTRLPLMYADAINCKEEDGTLLFLPVSPSFTEPSDVLGYYSASDNRYHPSETGLAEFLIDAQNNKNKKMYMVIFDEMNLSQIEYWFAPFLSVMEKPEGQRYIQLYSSSVEPNNNDSFPSRIVLNDNVIFIGTINLDETTKDLSDRLIDRAIIINLNKPSFMEHWEIVNNIDTDCNHKILSNMTYQGYNSMKAEVPNPYNMHLFEEEINFFDELHKEIQELNPSKGVSFRNVKKICYYLAQAKSLESDEFPRDIFFDMIFCQTILKKINGYDDSIKTLLGKLDENGNIKDSILIKVFDNYPVVSDFRMSREEIKKKIKEFNNYGFTR